MVVEGTSGRRSGLPRLACLLLLPLLAAAPGRAEPLRLGGQVHLPAGVRAEGVSVELIPAFEELAVAVRRLSAAPALAPLAATRPRTDGSYELTAPAAGFYRIVVRARGCRALESDLSPLVEETDLPPATLFKLDDPAGAEAFTRPDESGWVPWTDRPATPPTGQAAFLEVRNARGEPVAGALLRSPWDGTPLAATGPDGRLAVAVTRMGWRTLSFPVEAPDGGRAVVSVPSRLTAGSVLQALPRPPVEVTGRVVQAADGKPVAGALVWNGEHPTAAPARTDDDGRFRLLVAVDEALQLSAAAAGFLPLDRQSPERRAGPARATLRLRPAARLAGVVVDARGGPVAGAFLLAQPAGRTAWSRPDGRFRLSGLLPQGAYELKVQKAGFPDTAATARTAAAGREPAPLRIVLGEGQRAVGRVLDPLGRPLGGVDVALAREPGPYGQEAEDLPFANTISDARGAFELRHLSPGRVTLRAVRPGFAPIRRPGIEIGSGPNAVDLGVVTLEPGAAIEGVVVDPGGTPVTGARVDLGSPSVQLGTPEVEVDGRPLRRTETTGADGRFRFADLRRGTHFDLQVSHPGYAPAAAAAVEAPTPEPLQIELKVGRSVAGRVVGPRGEPVAGALLTRVEEVRIGGSAYSSASPLGETDAHGDFRLSGLVPGTLSFAVSARGYRTRRMGGIAIPEDRDVLGLELTLEPGVMLSGRVLDSRGEPVAGAHLWVHPEAPSRGAGEGFVFPHPTETDGAGSWSMDGLEPGPVRVEASSSRGRAVARLQLETGENHLDLTLPAGVEVAGRVTDETGEPLAAVGLLLAPTAGQAHGTMSEADGTFVFPGMPDGDFDLRATKSGYAAASYPGGVRIAGQPVDGLELHLARTRPAAITGRLLGLEPDELAGVQVSARGEAQELRGTVGSDGRYRIADAAPGEWRVQATSGSRAAAGSIRIEPDATEAVLDLEFQGNGLTLSGRVLVDGLPLAGAEILVGTSGDRGGMGRTAYDGSFSVAHLKAGPQELLVVGRGDGFGYGQPVEVAADRAVEIQVTTGRVHGTVRAAGAPVAQAAIFLEGQDPVLGPFSGPTGTTDDQGGFDLSGVGPGVYQVTVRKVGFAPAVSSFAVRPGEASTIEVELPPR